MNLLSGYLPTQRGNPGPLSFYRRMIPEKFCRSPHVPWYCHWLSHDYCCEMTNQKLLDMHLVTCVHPVVNNSCEKLFLIRDWHGLLLCEQEIWPKHWHLTSVYQLCIHGMDLWYAVLFRSHTQSQFGYLTFSKQEYFLQLLPKAHTSFANVTVGNLGQGYIWICLP